MAAAVALSASILWCATAQAHPAVDEARGRYERGDFEGTLATLDALDDDAGLSAADLVRLLELRVLAARALGDEASTDAALEALASLRPDHRFGPEVPPVVQARFASIVASSAPLAVEARAEADGDEVVLSVRAAHDRSRLVRSIRVHAALGGVWRTERGPSLRLRVDPGAEVAWFAELVGPGGAIVRSAGSREQPRLHRRGVAGGEGAPAEASSGVEAWPFLVAGGAAVVAAVVLTVALVLTAGVDTAVEGPIVMEFE